ncbi:hypothetical protein CDD83_4924 [Cordyceps sp. RAO-2017]|nr:hypothetical protein CDD83_4924 [Cordyceps sp. RAO-2017]
MGFSDEPLKRLSAPRDGRILTKTIREQLARDDKTIAVFERKLGIKKSQHSLPEPSKYDGLDELLAGLPSNRGGNQDDTLKRNRRFDDWVSSKRRKTLLKSCLQRNAPHDEGEEIAGERRSGSDKADRRATGSDCEGERSTERASRPQENLYVTAKVPAVCAKYIPPPRKTMSTSGEEVNTRLRKQVQGQINRLADGNLLLVLKSIDDIYQQSARGLVTDILIDAIMAQVNKSQSLPDQFFVVIGGFCAAAYKLIGNRFGSHLVCRVVKDFAHEYDRATSEPYDQSRGRKEPSNIIAFLTQLYVFEVVSCKILFDYMERLLNVLSETNVELLLRLCRMAGKLLRKDDPQALNHVAKVLNESVSKLGHSHVSVRTKLMIEIIEEVKECKWNSKGYESSLFSENVLRIRKTLGNLRSQSRRLDGLAAMGLGLDDIESTDLCGKRWLMEASTPADCGNPKWVKVRVPGTRGRDHGATDVENLDLVLPDYPQKARAQGLGTSTQIAIFTALMSANHHEQGYLQFTNLKLKRDEQTEIAHVLVHWLAQEVE